MVKKLLKKICSGVGMGCFVFVAVLFIAPVFAGGFLCNENGGGMAV